MKALWKGSISFGLVNIPIKLYSGTQAHNLNLDMIRAKDKCAIQYVRVCKKMVRKYRGMILPKATKRKMVTM
ncbi:hypothetical protein LRS05_08800 [Flavobacterium sp. J372]|uniref:hypothetical protein n=1 Tax=Flavobacterium sp. J372 TaxID=2898436 RepID=UPI0021515BD8|nr:hypothetical protein [Flavobacterium sp. J372]MCR5862236.1 hypothetical protein [Flavobacterium sp. J372]